MPKYIFLDLENLAFLAVHLLPLHHRCRDFNVEFRAYSSPEFEWADRATHHSKSNLKEAAESGKLYADSTCKALSSGLAGFGALYLLAKGGAIFIDPSFPVHYKIVAQVFPLQAAAATAMITAPSTAANVSQRDGDRSGPGQQFRARSARRWWRWGWPTAE